MLWLLLAPSLLLTDPKAVFAGRWYAEFSENWRNDKVLQTANESPIDAGARR